MKTKNEIPVTVFFFPNGMAAVCNADGQQIGKFQGRHEYTVEALREAGYDWSKLPDVNGSPRSDASHLNKSDANTATP